MSRVRLLVLALFALLPATLGAAPPLETPLGPIEFLGEIRIETGVRIAGEEVGGLSALVYDRETGLYHALSDDGAEHGAARLFQFQLALVGGRVAEDGFTWKGVTRLLDVGGDAFAPKTLDPEGLVVLPSEGPEGGFLVSSEGQVRDGVAPFLRRFDRTGRHVGALELPAETLPAPDRGIRHNRGGEGLAATPDGRHLFLAMEGPLSQDGPDPTPTTGALARIYRYELASGKLDRAYLVPLEPVHAAATPAGELEVSGISGLLALDSETLVILERSFARGAGHAIRLAELDLRDASDVSRVPSLEALDPAARAALRPAVRRPVLDLHRLGFPLDNLEGLTLGPTLPDGRRLLLMISDNNFNAEQFTQILGFAVGRTGLAIPAVQGAGHRSPFAGQFVAGLAGVVTALDARGRTPGFWLQGPPDGQAATSDAVFVATSKAPAVAVGETVRVHGRIEERGVPRSLTATVLGDATLEPEGRGELPPPVRLRVPRKILEDDGLTRFEPATDALDYWESLEAMRVELVDAVVVGPAHRGELVVLPDFGRDSAPRTTRGGLRFSESDPQPERTTLSNRLVPLPAAAVGDRLPGVIRGVLEAGPAGFRLVVTEPLSSLVPAGLAPEVAELRRSPERLTVATYNVENLDAQDSPASFARHAAVIVSALGAPDVIALQEVQDDNGAAARGPDGVVSAAATLEKLVAAVVAAGGPRYVARQIDPVEGTEGGEPGGNIRVAFLLDPARVTPVDRPAASARAPVAVQAGPGLVPSPGLVAPEHAAWRSSRVPLALEVRFRERPYFLVNNHWTAKSGDDRTFGAVQPPVARSEASRRVQAQVVRDFVTELLAQDAKARVVVLGDLNEFEGRAPLMDLTAGGQLVDLITRRPESDRYTYVFEGRSQVLDHVLVSPALADQAEIDIVHVHAEFPEGERASDHDPIVVRLGG